MPSAPRPHSFEFAWICPIEIEVDAAIAAFDLRYDDQSDDYKRQHSIDANRDKNEYFLGQICDFNVVLCLPFDSRAGPINAAIAYENLRHAFTRIDFYFLVGIGGGIPQPDDEPEIRLGDVVVGLAMKPHAGVVQIDAGWQIDQLISTTPLMPPNEDIQHSAQKAIDRTEDSRSSHPVTFRTIAAGILRSLNIESPDWKTDLCFAADYTCRSQRHGKLCPTICDSKHCISRSKRQDGVQKVHKGPICSSSRVIKDPNFRDKVFDEIRKSQRCSILCFEMECYAIAERTQCLNIRGISDYSDSHKTFEWQPYAAVQAAAFAKLVMFVFRKQKRPRDNVESPLPRTQSIEQVEESTDEVKTLLQRFKTFDVDKPPFTTASFPPDYVHAQSSSHIVLDTDLAGLQPEETPAQSPNLIVFHQQDTSTSSSEPDTGRESRSSRTSAPTVDNRSVSRGPPTTLEIDWPDIYRPAKNLSFRTIKKKSKECDLLMYINCIQYDEDGDSTITVKQFGPFEGLCHLELLPASSSVPPKRITIMLRNGQSIAQFWVPADEVHVERIGDENLYSWSDCRSRSSRIRNGWKRKVECYNAEEPNLKLQIQFNNDKDAEDFREQMISTGLRESKFDSWNPRVQRPSTVADATGRSLEVPHVLIAARTPFDRGSWLKLYLIESSFMLAILVTAEGDRPVLHSTITRCRTLEYSATSLSDVTQDSERQTSLRDTMIQQKWSETDESRKDKENTPNISLDKSGLSWFLDMVLAMSIWNFAMADHIRYKPGFVKFTTRTKVPMLLCLGDTDRRFLFCYNAEADLPWTIFEVSMDPTKDRKTGRDGIKIPIIMHLDTKNIQLGQSRYLEKCDFSLTIKFARNEDHKQFWKKLN